MKWKPLFHIKGISGTREQAGRNWRVVVASRASITQRNALNGGNFRHKIRREIYFMDRLIFSRLHKGARCRSKGDKWAVHVNPPLFEQTWLPDFQAPKTCLSSELCTSRKEHLEGWFPQGIVFLTILNASSLPVILWHSSLKQWGAIAGDLCPKDLSAQSFQSNHSTHSLT